MKKRQITRRDFLRLTAGTATALGSGIAGEARAEATARVVLVRSAEAVGEQGRINGAVIQAMLDQAVATLLGSPEPARAWQMLVTASDIVGIKSNAWERLPPPKELEAAIKRRVLDAGVAEKNLDIDDRGVL
ncbi:MAG TPA: hypothetical protein VF431_00945, partial [Candidatus Methylomirabilis sp.]